MNDVLAKHNSLMEKVVREHGAMIKATVQRTFGGMPYIEDVISEVHFAVFLTLRKLGSGWTPPRSFITSVIRNKVNEFLWQKYWDNGDIEALKKRQAEQAFQREDVMARIHTLTQSEFKVFRLLGLGLTNQEIAESLYISPLTVRTHVKRIHAKCGIQGRAKLALTAYQACYRELPESLDETKGMSRHEAMDFLQETLLSQRAS
jgi:RNA polymerase sigma factor (sigma-70 family)